MSRPQPRTEPAFPPYFLARSFRATVEEAIDRAQLVSFDVFDTLMRRPFLEPTHLFDALATLWSAPQFGRERRWAEAMARIRHAAARDVTLDQIYNFMGSDPTLELSFEKSALYPRPELTAWLALARAKGKKIIAISDMYLPRDFIAEVLATHRLLVDDVIVSSQDDVQKGDGSAFRLAASRHGVTFGEMVHFGDNPGADYDAPVRLGIPAVLVGNKLPRAQPHHLSRLIAALETNGSHHGSMVGSLTRDMMMTNGPGDFWTDIGRHIVAPIMTGFAQWAHAEAKRCGIDRLAFAARDGKLTREAFRALYGERTIASPYVHISRAVVLRAGLDTRTEAVLYQLTSGIEAPVSDYVKRIGDGTDPLLAQAERHFGGNPIVGRDVSATDLADFFHGQREYLAPIAAEARRLLYRYLEQEDLLREPAKVALLDVGWSGTAASVLHDAVPETRNWTWLYFGTRAEYKPATAKQRAMFFGYGVPYEHFALVFDCVEVTEFLFSAPEPTTTCLRETATGVEPVPAPQHAQWEGWAPRSEAIATGFRQMLPQLVHRTQGNLALTIDLPTIATLLSHVIRSNDPTIIREFGQLEHQLGFGASRFEPLLRQGQMPYWKNIWRMLKGRPLKPPGGRRYWKNQLTGQFLMPLTGIKLRLARKALRIQGRGGMFRRTKSR